MVHYYCFIPVTGLLSPNQKIFKVSVGGSKRDEEKARLVELYAKDANLYFHLWTDDAENEITSRMMLSPDASFSVGRGLKVVYCSISSLLKSIIDDTLFSLDDAPHVFNNYFKLNCLLSPKFYFQNTMKKIKKSVPPSTRKNLRVRPSTDDICAAISFGAILILYWLACLLRQWENSIF